MGPFNPFSCVQSAAAAHCNHTHVAEVPLAAKRPSVLVAVGNTMEPSNTTGSALECRTMNDRLSVATHGVRFSVREGTPQVKRTDDLNEMRADLRLCCTRSLTGLRCAPDAPTVSRAGQICR